MKRHLFILLPLIAAATAGAGEPFPLSATARQRYPWNGRVDVDVTFGGEAGYTYRVGLSAKDMVGDTNLPVRTVWREGSSSGGNPVPFTDPGTYRLIWDAASDLPAGFVAESVVVNATLTPIANPYTVRFNKNAANATGTMADQAFVYDMGQTLSTNAFSLKGYTFSGWATNTNGSVVYGNGQQVWKLTAVSNGVVNLYAKWKAITYKVGFYGNGADNAGAMSGQTFTYDVAQKLSKNIYTRTGYTFREWGSAATGGGTHWADQQMVTNLTSVQDGWISMYAIWDPITYTVRFNANGGSGTMANQGFTYNHASALRANAFTASAGATVDLYAVWTGNAYTVRTPFISFFQPYPEWW